MSSVVQAQTQAYAPQPSPDGGSNLVPGVWKPYYEIVSGKARGTGYVFNLARDTEGYYGNYEVGGNYGYGSAYVESGGAGGGLSSYGAGASAKTEGVEIKVIYKWEPQSYGPYPPGAQLAPPDPKLNFLLNGSAYVRANGGSERAFASVDSRNSPADATTWASAGATRRFTFDTKGQTEFSGTMPVGIEGSSNGSVNGAFSFSSKLDDRSVTLSRVGATGESTIHENGVQVTHGDTIYTYYDEKLFFPAVSEMCLTTSLFLEHVTETGR